MVPKTMKAIVSDGNGGLELKEGVDVPSPGPDEVLIKVAAAAQNPTDCANSILSICCYRTLTVVSQGKHLRCINIRVML